VTWVRSPKGSAGYLYLASAPKERFREAQDTLARILGSVRVFGSQAEAAAQPELEFERWTDPREQAFSLEIPRGWSRRGGMFRFASVDTRGALEVASPDGKIRITLGDATVPPFTEPTRILSMTGFREGAWYSPGYGVRMQVRRYQRGVDFAKSYVKGTVARSCSGLKFQEVRGRPDTVRALNAIYSRSGRFGIQHSISAGEASFSCTRGGEPRHGYYFAATQLVRHAGGGTWNVQHLGGFLAAARAVPTAQRVAQRIVGSFRLNPEWHRKQQGLTRQTSAVVSQTSAAISRMMSDTYWNRQKSMDELSRRRSNVILGREDVIDPVTGSQYKVESGSNYYWVDHRGTIVGTDTHTKPNIDFREMLQLP
jgi:hypothetical protein